MPELGKEPYNDYQRKSGRPSTREAMAVEAAVIAQRALADANRLIAQLRIEIAYLKAQLEPQHPCDLDGRELDDDSLWDKEGEL